VFILITYKSLQLLTTGGGHSAFGYESLKAITTNSYCTAMGYQALTICTGAYNTAYGCLAGSNLQSGSKNVLIGYNVNLDDSARKETICIGYNSTNQELADGTINIGFGGLTYTGCYIDAIYAETNDSGSASAVYCDNTGKLATAPSIRAKKQNIVEMGNYSTKIHDLKPVLFNWREGDTETQQWGLIAEEVEEVFGELARYTKDGALFTVAYHELVPLMLNEIIMMRKMINNLIEITCKDELKKKIY